MLGGKVSSLHRKSVSKRPWTLVTNGDLWRSLEEAMIAKGPGAFKVSKVKGHATDEMVSAGKVKEEDKTGNDVSDEAADKGAELTNITAAALGHVYSRRHRSYKVFMERIQKFIITIKKVEDAKRKKKEKEDDPFRQHGEARKVVIPTKLE
jgi:hypothetical protein